MRKIASILLDDQQNPERRCAIYLEDGRLVCDGDDITPHSGKYPEGLKGQRQARKDVVAMYDGNFWGLKLSK